MTDLDTLRPEVQEAMHRLENYLHIKIDGKHFRSEDYDTIRAELVRLAEYGQAAGRLADENARLRERVSDTEHFRDVHLRAAGIFRQRAEEAETELAALKARIAGSRVVKIANYGDPFIVLPDHLTVPNSLKGKTVHLLVEE